MYRTFNEINAYETRRGVAAPEPDAHVIGIVGVSGCKAVGLPGPRSEPTIAHREPSVRVQAISNQCLSSVVQGQIFCEELGWFCQGETMQRGNGLSTSVMCQRSKRCNCHGE